MDVQITVPVLALFVGAVILALVVGLIVRSVVRAKTKDRMLREFRERRVDVLTRYYDHLFEDGTILILRDDPVNKRILPLNGAGGNGAREISDPNVLLPPQFRPTDREMREAMYRLEMQQKYELDKWNAEDGEPEKRDLRLRPEHHPHV